jgi:RND family efflux transporter MFP subunit
MKVGDLAAMAGRELPGRARAVQQVNLSFRVAGPLVALPVKVGDAVKKGDLLAQIDPRDYEVQVRSAEGQLSRADANLRAMKIGARPEELEKLRADVREAEAVYDRWKDEYERVMRLRESNAAQPIEITRTTESRNRSEAVLQRARENLRIGETGARSEDIEAQEAEIASLRASLEAATDSLDYTRLHAPFDGTVSAVYVENFQTVLARERIVRLLDTSHIEMIVDMPESLISVVGYVNEVVVKFDAFPSLKIPAEIKEVGNEASSTTRTYPVTVIMDQPENVKILPGMSGSAHGKVDSPDHVEIETMVIPESAIFMDEKGETSVWIIDEGAMTTKRHTVSTGEMTPRGIFVTGLEPGQWVATAGVHFLREGQKVTILDNSRGG